MWSMPDLIVLSFGVWLSKLDSPRIRYKFVSQLQKHATVLGFDNDFSLNLRFDWPNLKAPETY